MHRFISATAKIRLNRFRRIVVVSDDVALGTRLVEDSVNKVKTCYHKFVQLFLLRVNFSVAAFCMDLKLPSFKTVSHNYQ